MLSLGQKLRQARIEQGLEIADLARQTKINAKFLEAIEAGRRDCLPAGFFLKSWALQYAAALSLDEKKVQAEVDRILSAEAPLPLPGQAGLASQVVPPVHRHIRRRGEMPRLLLSFALLILMMLGCSGLYAWWHTQRQEKPSAVLQTQPPPAAAAVTAAPKPLTTPQPRIEASAPVSDNLLLELYAKEQTWLAISPDGKQIFSGVLQAKESKRVEAHESARIKVGNAGGLDVRLNGKPVGEIGPKGTVRILLVGRDGVHVYGPGNSLMPMPMAVLTLP